MRVRKDEPKNQRWWLNPPLLVAGFIAFLSLAAISGSLGTQEQRSDGNGHWETFLNRPLIGLDQVTVIGTWRKDRRSWEGPGPLHCGIKVYAFVPDGPVRFFSDPIPKGSPWSAKAGPSGPLNSLTRMSSRFCDGPDRLMGSLHPRILSAWQDKGNERYCEVRVQDGTIFAGVVDRDGRRVYTWFSADAGLSLRSVDADGPAVFRRCV